jgi:DEAD/DEAH box helicase domain-containing protein
MYSAASIASYRTDACWLEVADHEAVAGGNYVQVHSLEHGLRATVPLAIPCDPYDLAGLTIRSGSMGHPTFYLYDAVKGGIGISAAIYQNILELLAASRGIFTECKCRKSCPRCIQLPRCPEDNDFTDRSEGLRLVEMLTDVMSESPELLNPQTLEWYQ